MKRVILLLLLIGICVAVDAEEQSSSSEVPTEQDGEEDIATINHGDVDVPATVLKDAAEHVKEFSNLSSNWLGAEIGDIHAIHRPDMSDSVAYYEANMVKDGVPAGFVQVSTGDHDHPVASFHTEGVGFAKQLHRLATQQSKQLNRIYKVDPLNYVGEADDGSAIDLRGSDLDQNQWQQFKQGYTARFADQIGQLKSAAQASWHGVPEADDTVAGEESGEDSEIADDDEETGSYDYSNGSPTTPSYTSGYYWRTQKHISVNWPNYYQVIDSRTKCYTGCGPVAWAEYLYLIEQKGGTKKGWTKLGGKYWKGFVCSYPKNGGSFEADPRSCSRKRMGPSYSTAKGNIENIVREIAKDADTICNPMSWLVGSPEGGSTKLWRMDDVIKFVKRRRSGIKVETRYNILGHHSVRIRNYIIKQIKKDMPCVAGVGWFDHYALVRAYCRKKRPWYKPDLRYFYLEQGWPGKGGNGWIPAGAFFAGWLY